MDTSDVVARQALRTGRTVAWYGDAPNPSRVIWGRPTRMAARVAASYRALAAFRPVRSRHTNRQPRSRSAKRSPRTVASGNRGDPHLGDDDPPLAPDFVPRQGASAVAQAFGRAFARTA
jgi:hypothetical protein